MKLLTLLALACSLATAQSQDPASDPLEKGYQALRSGREADAVQWFVQATEQMPVSALARKELGYAYLRLGQEADARREWEQAAQLDPNEARLALEIAFSWQRAADPQRARQWFEHAAARGDPEIRQTARDAIAYLGAARAASTPSPGASPNAATNAPPNVSAAASVPVHDAVHEAMTRAYAALRDKDYDAAILALREAVKATPKRADIRKQLAYAYLKIGETAWARDMFEQAVRLDPNDPVGNDYRGALELAFLRHETGDIARSRELFGAVAQASDPQLDPQLKATAEAALRRVDAELTASIARWKEAVEMDPLNRSAQLELADLYQKYGDPAKAEYHYLAGWLVPSELPRDEILTKLARARQAAGDVEGASGAWLLAARSTEPRIAETAKPHLPKRYPYASEFRRALELNPRDTLLRRDLAYLQLEVGNVEEARKEFEIIVGQDPNDLLASAQLAFLYLQRNNAAEAVSLLERASKSADQGLSQEAGEALTRTRESQAQPHHDLGEQSLKQSYLKDALREFLRAYEVNPGDFEAALKIGVISNLMKRDREAMRWFLIASESPDADIAQQARLSYGNLAPQYKRFTTTLWTFPFYSTRYQSAFQYSQLKTEMRLGDLPIRPYLSLRLVGDLQQRTGEASPQFLSESSLIAGVGVRAPLARGVSLWAEAGEAISYLGDRAPGVPRAGPDYRGGLNWFHGRGAHLGGRHSGFFHEINFDGVYVSRFDDDWIAYSQFRPGYRLPTMGSVRAQIYWNFNMTADRNRAYWANFVETGPGVRLRLGGGGRPLDFSINFLRGVHLINDFNPRRPNYYDLRIGLWYSMAM